MIWRWRWRSRVRRLGCGERRMQVCCCRLGTVESMLALDELCPIAGRHRLRVGSSRLVDWCGGSCSQAPAQGGCFFRGGPLDTAVSADGRRVISHSIIFCRATARRSAGSGARCVHYACGLAVWSSISRLRSEWPYLMIKLERSCVEAKRLPNKPKWD